MTGTTAVFAALAAGGCALALWAYALFRQERAAQRGEALSDRTLYEVGREAAARRDARGARSKESGDWEGPSMRVRALAVAGGVLAAFVFATMLSGSALVGTCAAIGVVAARRAWQGRVRRKRRELLDRQFARMLPSACRERAKLTDGRAGFAGGVRPHGRSAARRADPRHRRHHLRHRAFRCARGHGAPHRQRRRAHARGGGKDAAEVRRLARSGARHGRRARERAAQSRAGAGDGGGGDAPGQVVRGAVHAVHLLHDVRDQRRFRTVLHRGAAWMGVAGGRGRPRGDRVGVVPRPSLRSTSRKRVARAPRGAKAAPKGKEERAWLPLR